MSVYEKRREEARYRALEARREVAEKIPEYFEINDRITGIAMECANKVFEGDAGAVSKMNADIDALVARQKELLRKNGFPEDYLEEKYECNDCKDTGYINGTRKCHCLRQAIIRFIYRQSNIEDILQRENFDTLRYDLYTDAECEKMKGIIAKCREFSEKFGSEYRNILLLGNVGVGKTFLTNCMAKAIMDRGYSVIYFTSLRLFDTLSYGNESRRDVQDDIFTCDLLIIDDLGTETLSAFVASSLFDILNERDLRRKPTIISTNLSFEELGNRYSERSFSRIFSNYEMLRPDVADIRIRRRRSSL